jgi:hypothetical protein
MQRARRPPLWFIEGRLPRRTISAIRISTSWAFAGGERPEVRDGEEHGRAQLP